MILRSGPGARPPRGTLTGNVTDAGTNAPLVGATVRAVGPVDRTTTTDSSGVYTFTFLVGNYDVTAQQIQLLDRDRRGRPGNGRRDHHPRLRSDPAAGDRNRTNDYR